MDNESEYNLFVSVFENDERRAAASEDHQQSDDYDEESDSDVLFEDAGGVVDTPRTAPGTRQALEVVCNVRPV